jgi:putative transposase
MTHHVHLLMTPHKPDGIAKAMQSLGRRYVVYIINQTYQRTGTHCEGRYKAALIDSERYLLTCYRYIELNPVRAEGMVQHPGEYRWSSYRANALGEEDEVLIHPPQYLALGDGPSARQTAYRAFINTHIDERSLSAVRESLDQCRVLGREAFKDQVKYALARRVRPGKAGRPRKTTRKV